MLKALRHHPLVAPGVLVGAPAAARMLPARPFAVNAVARARAGHRSGRLGRTDVAEPAPPRPLRVQPCQAAPHRAARVVDVSPAAASPGAWS